MRSQPKNDRNLSSSVSDHRMICYSGSVASGVVNNMIGAEKSICAKMMMGGVVIFEPVEWRISMKMIAEQAKYVQGRNDVNQGATIDFFVRADIRGDSIRVF